MKQLFFYSLFSLLFLSSCQKEISFDSGTLNPPAVIIDTTLIKLFAIVDLSKPPGYGDNFDTLRVERFYYDSLNRLSTVMRYDSLVYSLPWITDKYFYLGNSLLPNKKIRTEKNSANTAYSYDTSYYTYYSNGKLKIDSTKANNSYYGSVSFAQKFSLLNDTVTVIDETNFTLDKFRFITLNNNLLQQENITFQYDNHPNPLYRPEYINIPAQYWASQLGHVVGGIDVKRIQKNNLTSIRTQYTYPAFPVVNTISYTYRNDGYPLTGVINDPYNYTRQNKAIYKY